MHAFAQSESNGLLIDFLLTAKAVILVFISGRGSAISSAKQWKSGSIYILVKKLISCLSRAQSITKSQLYIYFVWRLYSSVDNHIPRYDIFDQHLLRECNIYTI